MEKTSKIYVAGHNSSVAKDIITKLRQLGFNNIVTRERKDLDLTSQDQVRAFFKDEDIEYVFLLAARSTGFLDNKNNPADCFLDNIQIQNNVLSNCYVHNVKRVVFFSSDKALHDSSKIITTKKEQLLGEITEAFEPYSLSKLCGVKLCQYYNMQSQIVKYISLLPCYIISDEKDSSLVMTLVDESYNAKINAQAEVLIWGDENQKYQLLWREDVADAALLLMCCEEIKSDYYIVTSNEAITKKYFVEMICDIVGYKGKIKFDKSKISGQSRETSNEKISQLGWEPKTDLRTAIEKVYKRYLESNGRSV